MNIQMSWGSVFWQTTFFQFFRENLGFFFVIFLIRSNRAWYGVYHLPHSGPHVVLITKSEGIFNIDLGKVNVILVVLVLVLASAIVVAEQRLGMAALVAATKNMAKTPPPATARTTTTNNLITESSKSSVSCVWWSCRSDNGTHAQWWCSKGCY